jgi:hypothetical protein
MSEIITSKKEMARRLDRSPRYVRDMIRGGFELPCYEYEAIRFLRSNPHPTRFRTMKAKRPVKSPAGSRINSKRYGRTDRCGISRRA